MEVAREARTLNVQCFEICGVYVGFDTPEWVDLYPDNHQTVQYGEFKLSAWGEVREVMQGTRRFFLLPGYPDVDPEKVVGALSTLAYPPHPRSPDRACSLPLRVPPEDAGCWLLVDGDRDLRADAECRCSASPVRQGFEFEEADEAASFLEEMADQYEVREANMSLRSAHCLVHRTVSLRECDAGFPVAFHHKNHASLGFASQAEFPDIVKKCRAAQAKEEKAQRDAKEKKASAARAKKGAAAGKEADGAEGGEESGDEEEDEEEAEELAELEDLVEEEAAEDE